MMSDIFILTGYGLIAPIFAIYINNNLTGGSIFAAGLASTIFFITKSLVQLPFSRYVDKHDNKYLLLMVGTFFIVLTPVIYMFAKDIAEIYLAQVIYGVGAGLAFPTWLGIWTKHLDKHHESFEWSLYSTLVNVGIAISASIGAALADYVGFFYTFFLVTVCSLVGLLVLFLHSKELTNAVEKLV